MLKADDARKALRSTFIQNQTNGVRYAEPILDYREPRFQGPNEGDIYDSEQKEYWEPLPCSNPAPTRTMLRTRAPARTVLNTSVAACEHRTLLSSPSL